MNKAEELLTQALSLVSQGIEVVKASDAVVDESLNLLGEAVRMEVSGNFVELQEAVSELESAVRSEDVWRIHFNSTKVEALILVLNLWTKKLSVLELESLLLEDPASGGELAEGLGEEIERVKGESAAWNKDRKKHLEEQE